MSKIERTLGRQFSEWKDLGDRVVDAATGEPPRVMYRVVPDREWKDYQEHGVVKSMAGATNFSSRPDPRYPWDYSVKEPHHILEVRTSPKDASYSKMGEEPYVAVRNPIPLNRVVGHWEFPDRRSFIGAFRDVDE